MKNKGLTTRLVHADRLLNSPQDGAVHFPTSNSVLFEYKDVNELVEVFQGKKVGHVYSRSSSSSNTALQNILAEMEHGIGAVTFATGMAAITAALIALLKHGDHIVVSQYLFGNTRSFMGTLSDFGVDISYVDVTDVSKVESALRDNTRLVFSETIANPVTQVADLAAIGELCKQRNLLFLLDNTMTPSLMLDSQSIGASITVCSLTKYFAGHGSVLGGALIDTGCFDWQHYPNINPFYQVGDPAQWGLTQIKKKGLRDMGATLAPQSTHDISIGLETLALRLNRTCENAQRLANYLQGHPKVDKVYYPGLKEHPQHELATALFAGEYGGIFSIDLASDVDSLAFLNHLQMVICATHLGDTRTLALPVASTIFYENGAAERAKMGISENMIRFSVGIEDVQDIIADLEQAFKQV